MSDARIVSARQLSLTGGSITGAATILEVHAGGTAMTFVADRLGDFRRIVLTHGTAGNSPASTMTVAAGTFPARLCADLAATVNVHVLYAQSEGSALSPGVVSIAANGSATFRCLNSTGAAAEMIGAAFSATTSDLSCVILF